MAYIDIILIELSKTETLCALTIHHICQNVDVEIWNYGTVLLQN